MVGRVEDYVAKKEAELDHIGLTQYDRDIIGGAFRIEIPIGNRYQLRQIAGLFRAFADKIDIEARSTENTDRQMLLNIKYEARYTQKQIRDAVELTGKGRAPKPYRERQ